MTLRRIPTRAVVIRQEKLVRHESFLHFTRSTKEGEITDKSINYSIYSSSLKYILYSALQSVSFQYKGINTFRKSSCMARVRDWDAILAVARTVVGHVAVCEAKASVSGVNGLNSVVPFKELLVVQRNYLKASLGHLQDGVILFRACFTVIVFPPASVIFPFG